MVLSPKDQVSSQICSNQKVLKLTNLLLEGFQLRIQIINRFNQGMGRILLTEDQVVADNQQSSLLNLTPRSMLKAVADPLPARISLQQGLEFTTNPKKESPLNREVPTNRLQT